ncbi:HAMP domain-containing protein [Niveispirillum fermenti]|uniref:HAMP domain-containing protein n=1 Tax=Niveispirillum fermenti TaxID=1233113 RepID=UPI003A852C1A
MERGVGARLSSLRSLSTAIALGATILVGALAAGTTFQMAQYQVQAGNLEVPGDTLAKTRLLIDFQQRMGHDGFLSALAQFAETGNAEARAEMRASLDAADQSLRGLQGKRLTPAELELAADLKRLLDSARRALESANGGPTALGQTTPVILLTRYAALADRIDQRSRTQQAVELARLEEVATRGLWLGGAAVLALVVTLFAFLTLLGTRVLRPLSELGRGVDAVARGDWRAPLWGTERPDEFGGLARSIDAFRKQAAEIPDISVATEDGRLRLKFEGDYADLFEALTARLRGAGGTLAVLGNDVGRIVGDTKQQLHETLGQVNQLCAAAVRTVTESNREIRQATEMLGHAVAQVRAFDASGDHNGLDAVVDALRQHADMLADTLSRTETKVSDTLGSLSESDSDIRHASVEARDAAKALSATMTEAQQSLLSAVKILRASGDMLAGTVDQTGSRMTRAADAMEDGEKALFAALGGATSRLDEATEKAAARLEDAGHQVSRAADQLDDRAAEIAYKLEAALDSMNHAQHAMQQSAEIAEDMTRGKLEPLAEQFHDIQARFSSLMADVSDRADSMADAVDGLRLTSDGLRQEFERRRVEPGQHEAIADLLTRMRGSATQIADRVKEIGETAGRLAQSLTGGVDDATARLRDLTGDLRQETKALSSEAHIATTTLSRTVGQQERLLADMKSVAAELDAVRDKDHTPQGLIDLTAGLRAAIDAVHALVASADNREKMAVDQAVGLVDKLQQRIQNIEGMAGGLSAATAALHALAASDNAGRERENAELLTIAEALKARLDGIDRLGDRLDSTTDSVRGVLEETRNRERTDLSIVSELTQNLRERVLRLDGLSVDLSRAIDLLRSASRQNETASANAARDLGTRLAQIADQLRGAAG